MTILSSTPARLSWTAATGRDDHRQVGLRRSRRQAHARQSEGLNEPAAGHTGGVWAAARVGDSGAGGHAAHGDAAVEGSWVRQACWYGVTEAGDALDQRLHLVAGLRRFIEVHQPLGAVDDHGHLVPLPTKAHRSPTA
jgi:hypothetical protein